jgi:hypothetical protein
VTPLPSEFQFSEEGGDRFSGVDAISVVKLNSGNFRLYYSTSVSALDPDTLRYSDSIDGLVFGGGTAITGISPGSDETFAYPAAVALDSGMVALFQVEIRHLSVGAVDINNLMRAESPDGAVFSYNPAEVVLSDGSSLADTFRPGILKDAAGPLRLYYSKVSGLQTAISNDSGVTFGAADSVTILGTGDNYAPFPSDPSVIQQSNGRYLMFFDSIPTLDAIETSIFLAQSLDGKTFHVFDRPIIAASSSRSLTDPSGIILPDGSIRLYYVERISSNSIVTRTVKSSTALP